MAKEPKLNEGIFETEAIVQSRNQEPGVLMNFQGKKFVVDVQTATKIANEILDCAHAAMTDAALFAFGKEVIGKGDERAGAALVTQVRAYRKEHGQNSDTISSSENTK